MAVSLDIRRAHAAHRYGDIIQVLTWVNDERAMVLLPAHRKGAPWYIVCESAAFKYDDPQYLARQSRKAAEVLGMGDDRSTWYKLATIIHDGLPDLIRMPSAQPPDNHKGNFGHMTLKIDGETITQEDVRVPDDGMSYE